MKINESQRIGAINPYRKNNEYKIGESGRRGRQRDEINISPEAKELLGALKGGEESTQTDKIEVLKHSVSTGTYYVDSNKLAEKLMPYFKNNTTEPGE